MMDVAAAFFLGLASAPHCAAMCGGIATALMVGADRSQAASRSRQIIASSQATVSTQGCAALTSAAGPSAAAGHSTWTNALWFGSGKMLGYMALGAVAGLTGFVLGSTHGNVLSGLRIVAGLLLIGLGLYTAGWWLGLRRLEAGIYRFWQPLLRGLRLVDLGKAGNKLLVGALWGLLPCGIVYSVLGIAMATATVWSGTLVMLAFGLGTLPFVLGTGGLLRVSLSLLHRRWVKRAAGLVLMGSGILSTLMASGLLHRAH